MAKVRDVPARGTTERSRRIFPGMPNAVLRRPDSSTVVDAAWLATILALAALLGVLWLLSIPFHEAPDEAAHFQVVRFILDHGRLPRFDPDELWLIRTPIGVVETYAAFPPLAYIVMALAAAPFPEGQMWAARLVSLFCYLGTVALTFLAARRLVPGTAGVAVWAAIAVALLPQHVFTGAYVSNDAVGILLSALLWYLLVIAWHRRVGIWLALALGATVGALLITKYTFYALAATAAISALVAFHRELKDGPGGRAGEMVRPSGRLSWPSGWQTTLAFAGGILVTSGWWFARNWAIYGELIPGRVIASAKDSAGGNSLFQPSEHGITLLTLSTQTNFWELTLKSFFAGFGFMDVFLAQEHYLVAAGIGILGVIGLLGLGGRLLPLAVLTPNPHHPLVSSTISPTVALAVTAVVGLAATLVSTMAISAFGEYSPQGRYLFGPLVPITIGLAGGWVWLSRSVWLRWIPAASTLALLSLNLVSLFQYVIPRYYGNAPGFLVQIDRPLSPQPSGAPIEILGWALATGGMEWRPFSPSVVTDYRRPVTGVDVYLDGPPGEGAFLGSADYGFRRPDVRHTYGGAAAIERVGYRLVAPATDLGEGNHVVFACAKGQPAEFACNSRPFEVESRR